MTDTCGHNCRKLREYQCTACIDCLTAQQAQIIVNEVKSHKDLGSFYIGNRYNADNAWLFISTCTLPEYVIRAFLDFSEKHGLYMAITAKNNFDIEIMLTKKTKK